MYPVPVPYLTLALRQIEDFWSIALYFQDLYRSSPAYKRAITVDILFFHLFTIGFFQGPPSSISVNRRRRSRSIRPSLSGTTAVSTPRKSPPSSARGPARIAALSHTRKRTVLVGYKFVVKLSFWDLWFTLTYLGTGTYTFRLRPMTHVGSRRMYLDPDVWSLHLLVSISMPHFSSCPLCAFCTACIFKTDHRFWIFLSLLGPCSKLSPLCSRKNFFKFKGSAALLVVLMESSALGIKK